MCEIIRELIKKLLVDHQYDLAISYADNNELKYIKKTVVEKGLIYEAELCAENLGRVLTKKEYKQILSIAIKKTWIYTFLKCERSLYRKATETENSIMLNNCIDKGWLEEAKFFAKRLHKQLVKSDFERIMHNCFLLEYWSIAKKCALHLQDPEKSTYLNLIDHKMRNKNFFFLEPHHEQIEP